MHANTWIARRGGQIARRPFPVGKRPEIRGPLPVVVKHDVDGSRTVHDRVGQVHLLVVVILRAGGFPPADFVRRLNPIDRIRIPQTGYGFRGQGLPGERPSLRREPGQTLIAGPNVRRPVMDGAVVTLYGIAEGEVNRSVGTG